MEDLLTPVFNKDLLLFVTGLPSKISPRTIAGFFASFGPVALLKLSKQGVGGLDLYPVTSGRDLRRGFCILYAYDSNTYKTLLQHRPLLFYGRSLTVAPFREGSDQTTSREQSRQSLVLVKKVPSVISEELLVKYLGASFGPVKKIYRLQAESPMKEVQKQRKRKNHCYSVEFESEGSADLAAQTGLIPWESLAEPITIEKYRKVERSNQFGDDFQNFTNAINSQRHNWSSKKIDFASSDSKTSVKDYSHKQYDCRVSEITSKKAYSMCLKYLDSESTRSGVRPTQKKYYELMCHRRERGNRLPDEIANVRLNFIRRAASIRTLH